MQEQQQVTMLGNIARCLPACSPSRVSGKSQGPPTCSGEESSWPSTGSELPKRVKHPLRQTMSCRTLFAHPVRFLIPKQQHYLPGKRLDLHPETSNYSLMSHTPPRTTKLHPSEAPYESVRSLPNNPAQHASQVLRSEQFSIFVRRATYSAMQGLCYCAATGVFLFGSVKAATEPSDAEPIEAPVALTPSTPRLNEFQGDDTSLVLRTLGRQAGISVVVDGRISGTVTARFEDKTPRQAIDVVADAKGLSIEEKDGTLYLKPKNAPDEIAPVPEKSLEDHLNEFAPALSTALTKLQDSTLDHLARPETAKKIARAKRALYEALIAEGFTKDESLRIVLTDREMNIPDLNQ